MERRAARELLARLERDAQVLAGAFRLRYRALEAERGNVRRRYGACFSDGTIRIRLRHAVTRRPLKYSSLVNTLCHELAHLRHFDHGSGFRRLYGRILAHARREGIYRPAPPRASGPTPAAAPPVGATPVPGSLAASRRPTASRSRPPGARRPPPQQLPLFG